MSEDYLILHIDKKSRKRGTGIVDQVMEEIRRSIRDEPPTHYTLEIPSFSLLSKSLMERYDSGDFEAGGKLGLYPNGDKARNGQDHISLYLVLSETNSLPPSFEVTALFRFFVFHQIHGNYLTLEDANGKGRCFLSVTREWGFAQLIDLQTFKDPSNGYLVNDTCCFGVEVFICKERNIRKGERLSLISPSDFPNCTWKIENFSKLEEEFYHSDEFCAADRKC
ncbi:PREDICTED: ubiquitin carboxyl-terminal hydrolase 12-like [Nelumbo nucifera]|uniref:Ubiquitin carboxyl-terminal hydrolase 12-like n=1 Tax=Nelumbo nucifera TaxID=4432 RepID=A0A1U8Q923_NELNU|nr:PREDICTED: ubiquitin carboxyl-terminal hydrolase 12-like [Nelumbo nucifera]